jgi:hypothetical protein
MYNYSIPLVGIALNPKYKQSAYNEFIKELYHLISHYDYNKKEDFDIKDCIELLEENYNFKHYDLVFSFIKWVQNSPKVLTFSTYYHGGVETTPMSIEYTPENKLIINSDDLDNYTLNKKSLMNIADQVQDFSHFCSTTMDENLFNYLIQNEAIGLSFINVSS